MSWKIKHSTKSTAGKHGSNLTFSRLGSWKGLFLLSFCLYFALNAYSQVNTGSAPFLDSKHDYQISVGKRLNTRVWWITNKTDDTLTVPELGTNVTIIDAASDGGNERITITYNRSLFEVGNWFLQYFEYQAQGGGVECISAREFPITISENTFYLDLPVNDFSCNEWAGDTWSNEDGDISAVNRLMQVEFRVFMNKEDIFYIDNWQFDGSISITNGSAVLNATPFAAVLGTTNRGDGWNMSGISGGNFHMTVTTPDNVAFTSDWLTFTVNVMGDITEDFDITLVLTNGVAYSGNLLTYPVITTDNTTLGDPDRQVTRTVWGVPNTSVVMVGP